MTWREWAPQALLGFHGTELEEGGVLQEALQKDRLLGVILYDRNVESKEQLRRLCAQLSDAGCRWIAIDEEGGLTSRLPESKGFISSPSLRNLGQRDDVSHTRQVAAQMAGQLRDLGINLNFAPVVDLELQTQNFLARKERLLSAEPQKVVAHARVFVEEHRRQGVTTVLKHFPGHGSAHLDTHEGFVDVSEVWTERELEPFRSLIESGHVDMVMTSHLYNCHWNATAPASLSQAVIQGLLREQLGYDGPVVSDDLDMAAVSKHYSREEAASRALRVGSDLLLFANHDGRALF